MCVCVRVCVCVRAHVRACVRARICAHAKKIKEITKQTKRGGGYEKKDGTGDGGRVRASIFYALNRKKVIALDLS